MDMINAGSRLGYTPPHGSISFGDQTLRGSKRWVIPIGTGIGWWPMQFHTLDMGCNFYSKGRRHEAKVHTSFTTIQETHNIHIGSNAWMHKA